MQLFSIEVKIAKRIERALKELGGPATKKATRKALRAGAKVLLPAVKSLIPVKSGFLKKSIVVRAMRRSRRYIGVSVVVGKEGFFKGKSFYGGFVNWGTKKAGRGGKGKGQKAQNFMSIAMKTKSSAVKAAIMSSLVSELRKLAK